MKTYCDLHIHTAASPCGDDLMTPNNIVNMSLLKGLKVIAITDHQTVANCQAIMRVGQTKGLYVIPGMEIECKEEFHLIALFQDLQTAQEMEEWLKVSMPHIDNRPSLFGYQRIFNEKDEQIGEVKRFLLTSANRSAYQIVEKAQQLKSLIYPAHIDRNRYSILSNLGMIPEALHFNILEISMLANKEKYEQQYREYQIIRASDAHYLENIAEKKQYIEKELTKWIT